MKVKCNDVVNPNNNNRFSALTKGKEYIILSIEFIKENSAHINKMGDFVSYRLLDDDNILKPYPASIFEISSNKLPRCWICYKEKKEFELLPEYWAYKGFLENYYDDEPQALLAFQKAKSEIYDEEEHNN